MRYKSIALGIVLLALLSMVSLTLVAAQNQSAQGFVEGLLQDILSSDGRRVLVEDVSISIDGDVTAERIEVQDDTGTWLVMETFSLDWQPLSLLSNSLQIDSLSVERISVQRLPATADTNSDAAPPAELSNLRDADIKKVSISNLEVSEKVTGETFVFEVEGAGGVKQTPPEVRLDLKAQRTNGGDSRVTASMLLDPLSRALKLDFQLKEGKGGLVVNLLDIAGEPAVDLKASAKGSIDDWQGRFGLNLDASVAAKGTATVATIDAGKRLTLEADGEIGRLVSEKLTGLLGSSTQLVGSVLFEKAAGRARVERIRIENKFVQLRVAGPVDWLGTTSDLSIELRALNDTPLILAQRTAALGTLTTTGLSGDLHITGSLTKPDWKFSGSTSSLSSDIATLGQLAIDLRGAGIDPADSGTTFNGSVSAEVSQGQSGDIPNALLGAFKAGFAARTADNGQIRLGDTTIMAGAVDATLTGNLSAVSGAYDLSVRASSRSPLSGDKVLDRLLAGDVNLSGRVTGGDHGAISLTNWRLKSRSLSVTLAGAIDETLDLAIKANLGNLTELHQDLAGAARIDAQVSGDRSAPLVKLSATGENVTLVKAALANPRLTADLKLSVDQPSGQLDFSATLKDQPVSAHARLVTTPQGTRELREFSIAAGTAKIDGNLSVPASGGPSGKFKLNAPDLNDIAPFLLMQLSGRMNADLDLTSVGDAAVLKAVFDGASIAGESFAAATVSGDLGIEDATGRPRIKGQVELRQVRAADLTFASIEANASSIDDSSYTIDLDMKGNDVSGRVAAGVDLGETQTRISVSKLSGIAQGIAFSIERPFTVVQDETGNARLNDAALQIGSGRVTVDGQVAPQLKAKIALASVPLAPFELLANIPGLSGSLSGNAVLQGKVPNPTGSFELKGEQLTADELQTLGFDSLGLDASGTIKNRKISLRSTLTAAPDLTASIRGDVDLSRAAAIDIRATGKTSTAPFADRLSRLGGRLDGTVSFDMTVRGAVGQPSIAGTVGINSAVLGDVDGKFIVTDANGQLEIAGDQISIAAFRGRTGKTGQVSASGAASLDGSESVSIRVQIRDGVYADGTLVNARYDADMELTGALAASPLLQGEIRLKKTKITLSEIPPSPLRPLDVLHMQAPAEVMQQFERIRSRNGSGSSSLQLKLRIIAKDPITVSGRGLNASLGGTLDIAGTPSAIAATGSFRLRRGTLKLLARRLEFESGRLDFESDLDPRIHLVAVSRGQDATIRLTIAGRASAPEISVTSSPELPQEEALARLVFDRDLVQLSPFQIAQLASSIAILSGSGDSGILDGLQSAFGVDWLEITQTPQGETAVGAGKQINERLSIGVEQSTRTNTSRVIIDLGVTRNLKLRGAAGSDGSSRAGVFFEKDY